MAASKIETDTNRMATDISSLKSQISQAQNHLKTLRSELGGLSGTWTGAASDAFRQAYESDCSVMSEMLSVMTKLAECMETAKKEYISCEQSNTSLVKSISI